MLNFPSRETVRRLREKYPKGTVIRLLCMNDMQAPPVGTLGIVRGVDDAGDLLVAWETGSTLKIIYGEDEFEVVSLS